MSNILVVGGGFAGVWSAAAAVRAARAAGASELTVTLVAPGDDLVIRPRLYQADPDTMRVPLDRVLGPIGVRRVAATVTNIDTAARKVSAVERDGRPIELGYDRLVLATGSQLVRPDLPGAEHLHDVDTMPAAAALDAHLHRLPDRPDGPGRFTAVVVGAGFTGLEVATELVERLRAIAEPVGAAGSVRVVLVERADVVGAELGAGPRPQILKALAELGVEERVGVSVREVRPDGVTLSDGTELPAATVVWSAGVLASPLTAAIPAGRDRLGRLEVDEYLRVVGVPEVYAAGDTAAAVAEEGHHVMQSCQHALPQGRFAGHNVAADLLGLPAAPFAPDPYVTCLDLGAAGAVFTKGWDRAVELTEQEAKQRKRQVNEVWIYPPVDDAEELLRRADYRTSTRQPYIPLPA
ncbi:NAD(P)/FAD-dependent oxidoreductase [Pseudonocardia acaciae]|uniref:NAD(P)/FAD-dependent oxidoreductase n=1 Tax=Pseudonocardia acaciae TaxID=551276 RepID=UPI0004910C57|nr:FAD-dependent oxidoreductase [Pseudonocardia acaciae]